MSRIRDIPTFDVKYSPSEYGLTTLHFLVGLIGLTGLIVVFASTATKKIQSTSTWLVLCICCGDMVLCSMELVYGIGNLWYGGWAFGEAGCIINAIIIMGSCFTSVWSLFAVTLERCK